MKNVLEELEPSFEEDHSVGSSEAFRSSPRRFAQHLESRFDFQDVDLYEAEMQVNVLLKHIEKLKA